MKTTSRTTIPRRVSRRPNGKLRTVRQALPPLLVILYYLWHTMIPFYVKTSLLAFAGGGILLLLGQFFQKGVMEPLQEMQKTLGQVGSALLVYAEAVDERTAEDVQEEARGALRSLAGDLAAKRRAQAYYGVCAQMEILPTKESIRESVRDLILMSECVGTGNYPPFSFASERIQKALWLDL